VKFYATMYHLHWSFSTGRLSNEDQSICTKWFKQAVSGKLTHMRLLHNDIEAEARRC
jgi:hypothetical protein